MHCGRVKKDSGYMHALYLVSSSMSSSVSRKLARTADRTTPDNTLCKLVGITITLVYVRVDLLQLGEPPTAASDDMSSGELCEQRGKKTLESPQDALSPW